MVVWNGSGRTSSTIATQVPRECSSTSVLTRANPLAPRKATFGVANTSKSASSTRSLIVLSLKSQDEQLNSNMDVPDIAFSSKEDLNYLLKLGGCSVVGAAAIKYGSILLPEITRPNIVHALAMISAPVVIAVLLFIKESRTVIVLTLQFI